MTANDSIGTEVQARNTSLLIVGAGGHGRVVADAALAAACWRSVTATDSDPALWSGELLPGVRLLPKDEAMELTDCVFHLAIGSADIRERISRDLIGRLATVQHPRSSVSPYAEIAAGCFIAAQAVVAPRARLGTCVIVNHGTIIDHDCTVGDCSHVAPGASLGGAAKVGERVLVGAGARLLPLVSVCSDVTIGAGAVVTKSISTPGVYAGVPAVRIK
jgi:sugar O-acyltransferase (sialic acid O-acetyltransferase NeuD family)